MAVYTYSANRDPDDRTGRIRLVRDDTSVIYVELGKAYDLSTTELAKLAPYVVMTPGGVAGQTTSVSEPRAVYIGPDQPVTDDDVLWFKTDDTGQIIEVWAQ